MGDDSRGYKRPSRDTQTKEPQVLMMVKFGFIDDLMRDQIYSVLQLFFIMLNNRPGFMYLLAAI